LEELKVIAIERAYASSSIELVQGERNSMRSTKATDSDGTTPPRLKLAGIFLK
jgi:hypothetical protein